MTTPLTDFEWSELTKPETSLHAAWLSEIGALLPLLRQLDKDHTAFLWSPLPEANGTRILVGCSSRP